jgi:hypothetical protein
MLELALVQTAGTTTAVTWLTALTDRAQPLSAPPIAAAYRRALVQVARTHHMMKDAPTDVEEP